MTGLPSPITVSDDYLAAIHGVLGEIRDRLPEPQQKSSPDATPVSEPGVAPDKKAPTAKYTKGRRSN